MAKSKRDVDEMQTDDIIDDIRSLMNEIEEAKSQHATKEGQIETIMENLKDEFGVTSHEEATQFLRDLIKKRDKKKQRLVEAYEKLRSEYDW